MGCNSSLKVELSVLRKMDSTRLLLAAFYLFHPKFASALLLKRRWRKITMIYDVVVQFFVYQTVL